MRRDVRVEETNGQGAGCTAGAGRESRERDVRYVRLVVGERNKANRRRAQDEEMEEREDFKGV